MQAESNTDVGFLVILALIFIILRLTAFLFYSVVKKRLRK